MDSIIFVTLRDGEYADRWSSDLLSVAVSDERSGIRELTWEGQRSGSRDRFVEPGTVVAIRPSKAARFFDIVGKVLLKECTRERGEGRPAEYTLLVEVAATRRRIHRVYGDTFTHNSVLREFGYPTEQGAMPHGIYAKQRSHAADELPLQIVADLLPNLVVGDQAVPTLQEREVDLVLIQL
jgi:hypothetical protein